MASALPSSGWFFRLLAVVNRVGGIWFAVILLYGISGLFSPGMFRVGQVFNILQVAAFLGVVATGQTLTLLAGGIDLSVAGVITMANIVSTSLINCTLLPTINTSGLGMLKCW